MTKIKLRALTESDKAMTCSWHNQQDIKELYAGHPFPVNIEMESIWYQKILTSNFPTTVFGIELAEEKRLIGISMLKQINLIQGNAEIAIYIGDQNDRGKDYARLATLETLRFAFRNLGLNRLYLYVLKRNIAASKLYKKLGFSSEGELIESKFISGKYENEIIMGLLARDFDDQDEL